MKKVLVCGERSFVANGFINKLAQSGISYDCFSRGLDAKIGNMITGDVMRMSVLSNFDTYDTILNFIILKDKSIEDNIAYVRELLNFCKKNAVKHLIQVSSISVYPNDAKHIDENSEIENDASLKGGYGSIKVLVDKYLMDNPVDGLTVSFVRPGYVYAAGHDISNTGIVKSFPFFNILFGDKQTTLPQINREILHDALIKIVLSDIKDKVYHVFDDNKSTSTKYVFAKNQWNKKLIVIPRFPLLFIAIQLNRIGIISSYHLSMINGLFRTTNYSSQITQKKLDLSFNKKQFCVIGAGAYGSYVCNLLSEKYPHEKIYLYDVGNEKIKDEKEIGFFSNLKAKYSGLQKGRFFGLGGSTAKWGGQLFTFTDNDFDGAKGYLQDIVNLNKKWSKTVFSRFNLQNEVNEPYLNNDVFIKTGIWLGYFHRNLFRYFSIAKKKQINILVNCRVVKLNCNKNAIITDIEYIQNGTRKKSKYDHYFLATGAFETARLLLHSELIESDYLTFSDHLSQRAFKIKSGTKINDKLDFVFKISGTSLITKRLVGEIEGISYFCHPIYNSDFPFFQNFKKLLFGRKLSFALVANILRDLPSCFQFAWFMLVKKTMFVYNNEYYLQIDIENPINSGTIKLCDIRDKYGELGLEVDFRIDKKTDELFLKSKKQIKAILDYNNVDYEEIEESTNMEKYEDTYHPFGIYSDFDNIDSYFDRFDNMLVINTGILARAGGINSTCAVFPIIEEYIERIKL